MARRWQENTSSGPRLIGGRLLAPGEGTWIDDGPIDGDQSPRLSGVVFSEMAADGRLVDGQLYVVDGLLRQAVSQTDWDPVAIDARFTAKQLSAMASAGQLVPNVTYVPSDASPRYPIFARSENAYELMQPGQFQGKFSGGNYYGPDRQVELRGNMASLVPDGKVSAGWYSAEANGEVWSDLPLDASVAITASVSGGVLTISAVGTATTPVGATLAGVVKRGHYVTMAGLPAGTYITSRGTGTGGTGTYNLVGDGGATIGSTSATLSCINGIGGNVYPVADTFIGDSSTADQTARAAWRFTVQPTDATTVGQGRSMIRSAVLTPQKRYRVETAFRLHQHSSTGWQTVGSTICEPIIGIGGITQDSGPYDLTNALGLGVQDATSGPFALVLTRGRLEANVRTPYPDGSKVASDGLWSWGASDRRQAVSHRMSWPIVGTQLNVVAYEFYLDHRQLSEGGRGYIKVWADQNLLMDYRGPTCFPVGRVENVIGDVQIYVGLYDITFSPLTEPNVCSNHASTNTERSIDFQYVRVLTEL